jgi:hypothetical protein
MGLIFAKGLELLGRVPIWVWVVIGLALWGWIGHHEARVAKASLVALQAEYKAKADAATLEYQQRADRIARDQQEAIDASNKQVQASKAAAARAAAAAAELRKQLAASGRQAPGDQAPAAGGAPSADTGTLLGECAERYSAMAAIADRARDAGLRCEQLYDAVSR